MSKIFVKLPSPGPSSTILNFCGLPKVFQAVTSHIPIISENKLDIPNYCLLIVFDVYLHTGSSKRESLTVSKKFIAQKGVGGLSGRPIFNRSKSIVSYIHKRSSGTIPIIAVGGIMTADDALEMFNCGASLVQIYTGFIYKGPSIIKDINLKLIQS